MIDPKLSDFSSEELQELLNAVVLHHRDKQDDLTAGKMIYEANGSKYPNELKIENQLNILSLWRTQIRNAMGTVAVREKIQSN